jgi:hypothetical protein
MCNIEEWGRAVWWFPAIYLARWWPHEAPACNNEWYVEQHVLNYKPNWLTFENKYFILDGIEWLNESGILEQDAEICYE